MLRDVPFHLGDSLVLVENRHVRGRAGPDQVTIPIGAKASGLWFAHTCTSMGPVGRSIGVRQPIARYTVRYIDGTAQTIDIVFGYHVAEPTGTRAMWLPILSIRYGRAKPRSARTSRSMAWNGPTLAPRKKCSAYASRPRTPQQTLR